MKFLTVILALGFSGMSQAADSMWLLCQDGHLAVNLVEHRAGADTRETNLTLILGAHLLQGTLQNTDSDVVQLKSSEPANEGYSGLVTVDYQKQTVTLKGQIHLELNYQQDVHAVLKCQELTVN